MLNPVYESKYQTIFRQMDNPFVMPFEPTSRTRFSKQPNTLKNLITQSCHQHKKRIAVRCEEEQLSYAQLDAQSNQLARFLLHKGIQREDRVGILLDRSLGTYITLLAIIKAGAVFVPMDAGFPHERISYIAGDAALSAIVTTSNFDKTLAGLQCPLICLDSSSTEIQSMETSSLNSIDRYSLDDKKLCYIIYTSGSTGTPKGVAIEHASICNFINVASNVYDIRANDRIYQGMTIAFDFSIEEIWLGLLQGATLVAGPNDERRLGSELADFLIKNNVTVLCCVPTLLATIDKDIPSLRTLIVGGEACPQHLVERWANPKRRMLNTYGPTEATVTASWGELYPGKPVTIGKAMPTYTLYLLDDSGAIVEQGKTGEICIAGIGLARCYINQEEKTRQAFIQDTFNTPENPSKRIYRTGDLGRECENGEIEYLGRIDTQVKIRGYRIELAEIESIILESPEIQKVVVAPFQTNEFNLELVAYCEIKKSCSGLDKERILQRLANRLPSYMIPAFLEHVDKIPLLANGKINRNDLPAPISSRSGGTTEEYIQPKNAIEQLINDELGQLLGIDQISVTDDFFQELGAHSLIAARLVSILRKDQAMSFLSLSDLYHYPTIRQLAEYIDTRQQANPIAPKKEPEQPHYIASNTRVWACGIFQILSISLVTSLYALPGLVALNWLRHHMQWMAPNYLTLITISSIAVLVSLLLSLVLPIAMKQLIFKTKTVKPGTYPLWSNFFLRFWLMDKLLSMTPLPLLSGTPLLSAYYRLLGAKIGNNVVLCSPLLHLPELIEIGNGASINTGSHIFCYSTEKNYIKIAPVRVGDNCIIGSNSILMPGSTMGAGANLGNQSFLGENITIPAQEHWSGSPARKNEQAQRDQEQKTNNASSLQNAAWQNIVYIPAIALLTLIPFIASFPSVFLTITFFQHFGRPGLFYATPFAALSFLLCLHLLIIILKNLVIPTIKKGTYPVNSVLYMRKWFVDRLMELSLGMANSLYATLYLAPFLRRMGAKIGSFAEISTISYITPDLLQIDDESFVADIAHLGPAVVANGLFTVAPVHIKHRSFVGNAAFVPGDTTIGDNTLIGVLSVPPGPTVPSQTTWLGSPPMELPEREQSAYFPEHLTFKPTKKLICQRLLFEYFRITLPLTLILIGTNVLFVLTLFLLSFFSTTATALFLGPAALVAGIALTLLVAAIKKILMGTYRTDVKPMWSTFVWRSELVTALYENIVVPLLLGRLTGTPFLAPVLRLFGVKIGSRCFIETTYITEFDLVKIGDDCCIGKFCSLQTHLFEDRVMKMSELDIGSRCSVGPRAVILYDATLENNVVLEGLSLVMKGETLSNTGRWHGSPATTV